MAHESAPPPATPPPDDALPVEKGFSDVFRALKVAPKEALGDPEISTVSILCCGKTLLGTRELQVNLTALICRRLGTSS